MAINFQLQRLRSMLATLANWSLRIKRLVPVPYDANAFASVLVTSVDVIVNQPCHFLFLFIDSANTRHRVNNGTNVISFFFFFFLTKPRRT